MATDKIGIPVLESFGDNNPRPVRGLNAGPSACHPWNWDKPLGSTLMCLPGHPVSRVTPIFDSQGCRSSSEHPLPPQSIQGCLIGVSGGSSVLEAPSTEPGHGASPPSSSPTTPQQAQPSGPTVPGLT